MSGGTRALSQVFDQNASIAGTLSGAGVVIAPQAGEASSGASALAAAIWFGYLNEAATMAEQEYATRDDIDAAMRFGCGYPVGPLAAIDAFGLDKVATVLDALYEASGDMRHRTSAAISDKVAAGHLGQASGQGFYEYESPGSAQIVAQESGSDASGDVRDISLVGVVGTGTMATGIVEVFAKAGYDVIFVARSEEKIAGVQAALTKSLDRQVSKGRLDEAGKNTILARVTGSTSRGDLGEVDIVVEAIVEDLVTKQQLFAELDTVCKPGAILATTTSSLSIDTLAACTSRPGDVVGMHFFNPAPIMKLVEVVTGEQTADDVRDTTVALCKSTKKHPVLCGDRAGFIVNFLLFPYLNDAVRAVDEELIDVDSLNGLMKEWLSLPMGPFSLLDVVGNDVSLAIEETIHAEFADECYEPAVGLRAVVAAGKLGRKTGAGFLSYN